LAGQAGFCAAYRVMTAKSGTAFLFTPDDVAALFYIALTVYLSRMSQFADSRRPLCRRSGRCFATTRRRR
jgi:hypothetical protein